MKEPRYYQIEALDAIFDYFGKNTGNPVVALPTGTGKAYLIAMFLMKAFYHYPNQKMLVLTHVQELIAQNFKELVSNWVDAPAGINSAGLNRRDFNRKIIFAGIGSVYKDAVKFGKIDVILIDECHLLSPNDETIYRKFIAELLEINPYLKVIGLSATPWRLGLGYITENGIFTDICYDLTTMESFNKLISLGFMTTLIPKKTNYEIDISSVGIGNDGEFKKGELQLACDKNEVTWCALQETINLAMDRNCWLVFASGVDHCEHIVEMLEVLGISAACIHSRIKKKEREERFELFMTGKIKALVGFRVMTTGFNHPPIDLIVDLYPTTSSSMHVQKYGRGTRPYDPEVNYIHGFDYYKENCMVLDFAGNTRRLGPINDPVIPRKKGTKPGKAPVRICMACNCYNHASARFCIACNHEVPVLVKIEEEAGQDVIIKEDIPVVERFRVDHITYSEHKKGEISSLKVSYFSGLRIFNEFVNIERTGYVKNKANTWWFLRAGTKSPDSILTAMYLTDSLKKPIFIDVIVNKKYPEILQAIFDDTIIEVRDSIEPDLPNDEYDDSIPFNTSGAVQFDKHEFPF